MSSGTFAAFPNIHLNTSKHTFMKVVGLVEGHNFHVDGISNFGGKIVKSPLQDRFSCFPEQDDIQS
jgi:hypothetical protein